MDTEREPNSSALLDELIQFEPASLLAGDSGHNTQARGCGSCIGCGAECVGCGGLGTA